MCKVFSFLLCQYIFNWKIQISFPSNDISCHDQQLYNYQYENGIGMNGTILFT